jgi:hypothetical protein
MGELNMKTFIAVAAALACLSMLHAVDEFPALRTRDGKTYQQVRVTRVDAVELRIMHADGFATIPLSMLPPELLARYGGKTDMNAEQQVAAQRKLDNMRAYVEGQAAKAAAQEAAPAPTVTPPPQEGMYGTRVPIISRSFGTGRMLPGAVSFSSAGRPSCRWWR